MAALKSGPLATVVDLLGGVRATARDLVQGLPRASYREALRGEIKALATAGPRLAPWLLRSRPGGSTSFLSVALERSTETPWALALEMGDERLSWRDLDEATSRLAHVLYDAGVRQGDVVALLSPNAPFYVVAALAATRVGAVAALINTHLEGKPLAHALRSSKARVLIVHRRFEDALDAAGDLGPLTRLVHGPGPLDEAMSRAPSLPFQAAQVSNSDDFVYIYTSGTTGLPKPCKVSHGRAVQASAVFVTALWELEPGDKIYCVLPLYHSSGFLLGVGSSIIGGVPVALREVFSARHFWPEVHRYRATCFLYIGEICRHLLNSVPSDHERSHRLRIAVGNGMRADVWEAFAARFHVPLIREFYAATEAPGGVFNLSGKVGSVGRVPVRHLTPARLIRYDTDRDEHVRTAGGSCVECGPDEVGEMIVKLSDAPLLSGFEFRGYTDAAATRTKILTDVFRPGDRYYRTGDLMRCDVDGFFYFVDRIGDTFRWKGENVSTMEVAEVLGKAPGVREITVVGVRVPGMEGQAGLAALVLDGPFDAPAFWAAAQGLPAYAQPRFVRVVDAIAVTSTHKIQKTALRAEGIDPARVQGPVFVRQEAGYLPLDDGRWQALLAGHLRL
jgi:fatty-acyl-CoA synthase